MNDLKWPAGVVGITIIATVVLIFTFVLANIVERNNKVSCYAALIGVYQSCVDRTQAPETCAKSIGEVLCK